MTSRTVDLVLIYQFIKRLTTPFNETEAFKLGIIDKDGKKLKSPDTKEEQKAYGYFDRLVFNVKKLIEKAPGGKSKVASFAAALFLIRESVHLKPHYTEKEIAQGLYEAVEELTKDQKTSYTDLFEARNPSKSASGYDIYHKTYSAAIQHAIDKTNKKGFDVDQDDYHAKVATGPRKPSNGKTNSFAIDLVKRDGSPAKKRLNMQIYNTGKNYELNMYVEEAPANATGANVSSTGDDVATHGKLDGRTKQFKTFLKRFQDGQRKRKAVKDRKDFMKQFGL